jgi:AraC-like DNA-binding protein
MNYREYPPAVALQRFIECFWTIKGERESVNPKPGCVTPDGAIEIVLSFADPMRLGKSGEPLRSQPHGVVIGQLEQGIENQNLGRADYLGLRFRPAGLGALLRFPPHELTGNVVSLNDLAPALDRELAAQLGDIQSPAQRIQALEQMLLPYCRAAAAPNLVVEAALQMMQQAHGDLSMSALMARFELSGRQIERLFQQYVGLRPKSFSRILRFKQVMRMYRLNNSGRRVSSQTVREGAALACAPSLTVWLLTRRPELLRRYMRLAEQGRIANWAELSLLAGYYDQAHLIRDFRQFAGQSPTQLISADWYASSSVERL